MVPDSDRWNHNIHYHQVVLDALPHPCGRALDIGCGDGIVARFLHARVPHVDAIDLDEPSIRRAHEESDGGITYLLGDFLRYPFEPESYDFVVSVAALHHMDATAALERMRSLLRPGGALCVVGLARGRYPTDLGRDLVGHAASRIFRRTKGYWEQTAPTRWPPPNTFAEARSIAEGVLPGVRYRRHLLWRYSLIWTKPA